MRAAASVMMASRTPSARMPKNAGSGGRPPGQRDEILIGLRNV